MPEGVKTMATDVTDRAALKRALSNVDAVISACPYYLNITIAELCRDRRKTMRRRQRHLGCMPDCDPAAPAVLVCLAADIFDLHALSGVSEVEMPISASKSRAREDPSICVPGC